MKMKNVLSVIALLTALFVTGAANAAPPETVDGVTTIHLNEFNGYFAADETLASLKPGNYQFVVTNKAKKLVGFLLQDGVTHERMDMFPLEPGESRTVLAKITENGFRYRCPINPTPWYEVSVSK